MKFFLVIGLTAAFAGHAGDARAFSGPVHQVSDFLNAVASALDGKKKRRRRRIRASNTPILTAPPELPDRKPDAKPADTASVTPSENQRTAGVPSQRPVAAERGTTTLAALPVRPGNDGDSANDDPVPAPPDTWRADEISSAYEKCDVLLRSKTVEIVPVDPMRLGACGMPGPVRLSAIGEASVAIRPSATLNCRTVAQIHEWLETKVQPAAVALLQSRVIRVRNVSSYACRNRNNVREGRLSEHALGNALDVAAFVLADGRTVSVLDDWGVVRRDTAEENEEAAGATRLAPAAVAADLQTPGVTLTSVTDLMPVPVFKGPVRRGIRLNRVPDPGGVSVVVAASDTIAAEPSQPSAKSRFLKRIHGDACGIFGTVLGPAANDAHRDHFHLDTAERRSRAYCR